MSKPAQIITANPIFSVVKKPSFMQLPDGTFVENGGFINVREDTHEVVGHVSGSYGIIQNSDAINAVEEAFSGYGIGQFTRKVRVTNGGAGLFVTYDFSDKTILVPQVNDVLGLRLTLLNSFDGSSPLAFEVGFLRLVCLNGMKAVVKELTLTKKHFGTIDLAFIKARLAEAVSKAENSAQLYTMMAQIVISQIEGEHLIANLAEQGVLSNKGALRVLEIWRNPRHNQDRARNLYNLYNAVTQFVTHDVETDRFERARLIGGKVTHTFSNISRSRDLLTPMLMAPPKKD